MHDTKIEMCFPLLLHFPLKRFENIIQRSNLGTDLNGPQLRRASFLFNSSKSTLTLKPDFTKALTIAGMSDLNEAATACFIFLEKWFSYKLWFPSIHTYSELTQRQSLPSYLLRFGA